ncbi:uncharacterized protein LOC134248790 [Saccostrea cucullata]|uniref:uncharacterized protein LOC134248790 n=1 Tax=Saccostrea cuccullata TaxID=36930 RepID=UPI002ED244E2
MATAQGQDIIRCQLCSNPVEHHCNLCHVELCLSCIPKHMADKSRRHEVVEYTFRKEHSVILPSCLIHKKYQCETYCKNCEIPICLQCLMDSHKKHEFTNINYIIQEHKQNIISDTEELENTIDPKYRNINLLTTAEFDKVLSAIKEQEDKICKAVRKKSIQLTEETRNEGQKKPGMLKMMEEPVVLGTIQSPYGHGDKLWRVQCVGRNKILISGNDKTIKKIDRIGIILQTIKTNDYVLALTINLQQEPVFSVMFTQKKTKIYMHNNDKVKVLLSTPGWFSVGLCFTMNGDLLVSMRTNDHEQSRVVRYLETKTIQSIQYESQGQPLFSTVSTAVLLLAENGNGDICVADNAGKAVVVVDSSGRLRFKYTGNLSKQSKYREFKPSKIAADVNMQILINDNSNDIVNIIDCNGNFICYIEHPCNGGLSIDSDQNLVIGDQDTGIIQIIKYLE